MASSFPEGFFTDEELTDGTPSSFAEASRALAENDSLPQNSVNRRRPDETEAQWAKRILTNAAPDAAQGLAHLARYAQNENVRIKAQTAILDRVLDQPNSSGNPEDDPLMKLINASKDRAPRSSSTSNPASSASSEE